MINQNVRPSAEASKHYSHKTKYLDEQSDSNQRSSTPYTILDGIMMNFDEEMTIQG